MYLPKITSEKCEECRAYAGCVDICPAGALTAINNKVFLTNPEKCLGCESCLSVCPEESITIREISRIYLPEINGEKCSRCVNYGDCVDVCPADVLCEVNDKILVAAPYECLGCGACVSACPESAVTICEI
jgi:NAD-dependent dihydropyrimidine dehydrogenase PreA subunit